MSDWDKILKSFSIVEKDWPKFGSAVMTRLFTIYPYTQKMWPKMAPVPQIDMANDAHITNIGAQVVRKWTEMVKSKGNHMEILKPQAYNHAVTYQIPICYMRHMPETIRNVMCDMAGLDASGKETMKKMMDVILCDMNALYKEYGCGALSI